jgi:hypothetical protein
MMTTKPLNDGGENTYAYGIDIQEYRGLRYIGHSGSWASHTSHLVLLPDLNTSLFVAHNFRTNTQQIINRYVDTLLPEVEAEDNKAAAATEPEAEVHLANEQLDRFVGVYQLGKAWIVTITREGSQLLTTANGEGSFPMKPIGPNVFRIRAYGNRTMTFNEGSEGHAVSVTYNDIVAPRIELAAAADVAKFEEFSGVYYNVPLELMLNVVLREEGLFATSIRHGNIRLIPVEGDLFIGDGVIRSVKFSRDANGKVTGFHVTNSKGENRTAFVKA